ncbi:MAG: aminotransferase class V-fold PLP-dependent enzyme [Anaerolineae bacterium]|nr:aminotransferase class V-fold PLP-dependent enzyme [Anaerolineae bacterium]
MAVYPSIQVNYDIWALRAEEFPVSHQTVYLNHAGISPLPRRAVLAMQEANERLMYNPSAAYGWFLEREQAMRANAARLINAASPDEIVGVQSTSLGLNLVAQALPWHSGENILLCDVEFPSNVYPWMRLVEQHGVEVRLIPARDGGLTVEALAQAADSRTRLVAVSAVQFLSGHRSDLQAIGDFCHAHGLIFAVDAIQAAGHIPIDVQAMHIGILAAGGQKSLMAPPGQGFLYVRSDLAEQMRPTLVGPNATEDWIHWLKYNLTPLKGAARFTMGTSNVSGIVGLNESLSLLLELGLANIDSYVTELVRRTRQQLLERGYAVLTPSAHAGILTFRAAPDDASTDRLVKALAERNIVVVKHWDAHDVPYVRASFHCYNIWEESERLLAALEEIQL